MPELLMINPAKIEALLIKSQSSALKQYVSLLIRLHEAMREGDEEKAERVRDQMDAPGLLLDEEEVALVKEISSDLYMLADEEILEPSSYSRQELQERLEAAAMPSDADTTLRLLREEGRPPLPTNIAYTRFIAYQRLGLDEVARVFLLYAADLVGALTRMGIPQEDAELYAEGVSQGGTLVIANVPDDKTHQAVNIMNANGAADIEPRGTALIEEMNSRGETVIPIVEEELAVGKRTVQSGGARIHTYVTERPVGQAVTDADMAFGEKSFEVTETAEEAVVGKTARVVEEVVAGKTVTDRTETVRDTVRRTDVDIQDIDGNQMTGSEYNYPRPS